VHRLKVTDELLGAPLAATGFGNKGFKEVVDCLNRFLEEGRVLFVEVLPEIGTGKSITDMIAG
jgi:hypothetical protein